MSALMNECAHGSDGSYRDDNVPGCPYCEIDHLRAALGHVLPWVQKEHLAVKCWQCERAREALEGGK